MAVKFAYGFLDLDQKEAIPYIKDQIDEGIFKTDSPLNQVGLVFDLIATPEQIQSGTAHRVAQLILDYVDQNYPGLLLRYLGITDDESRRPMRDILLTKQLQLEDVDNQHLFVIE